MPDSEGQAHEKANFDYDVRPSTATVAVSEENGTKFAVYGNEEDTVLIAHIQAHPLFLVLKLLAHKCDLALGLRTNNGKLGLSSEDEIFKIDDVIQLLISLRDSGEFQKSNSEKEYSSLNSTVGAIICEAIFNLRIHLSELAKVWEFAGRFCDRYIEFLKCSKTVATVQSSITTVVNDQRGAGIPSSSASSTDSTVAQDNIDDYNGDDDFEKDYGSEKTSISNPEIKFEIKTENPTTVAEENTTDNNEKMPNSKNFNFIPLLMASNSFLLLSQQHQQQHYQQEKQLQQEREQQMKEQKKQQLQQQQQQLRQQQQQQKQQPRRQQQLDNEKQYYSSEKQPITVPKKRKLPFSTENLIVVELLINTADNEDENGANSKRKKPSDINDVVNDNNYHYINEKNK